MKIYYNYMTLWHWRLKTGVMMMKIQLFITGIKYTLKYIEIKNLFWITILFDIIGVFTVFYVLYKYSLDEQKRLLHNLSVHINLI